MRDRYWHVEETGDTERIQSFISMLEASVNHVLMTIQTKKHRMNFILGYTGVVWA
jgi:hypothetical protein